jgi:hypothetical protein
MSHLFGFVVGCFRCDREIGDPLTHCHAALPDEWGYGQPCGLDGTHRGLHRYERGDGFVIQWGFE